MAYEDFIRLAPKPRELKEGQEYTVFLSYRSVNRAWVIALRDALVQAGHTVFLDQTELVTGSNLRQSIENALVSSQSGILIWSNAAQDSQWVRNEFDVLKNQAVQKPDEFFFLPVRIDKTELPPMLNTQLFLDLSSYPDGPNGGELLHLLHGIVGEPLSDEAMHYAQALSEKAKRANNAISAAIKAGDIARLKDLAYQDEDIWRVSAQLSCQVAEGIVRLGDNETALELTNRLIQAFPSALRPKQLNAHVLTRINTSETLTQAKRILGDLVADGQQDPETMGLFAKVWFEEYTGSGDNTNSRDKRLLRIARNHYNDGFKRSRDDTYCGINAATKTLILGNENSVEEAQEIAKEVRNRLPDSISSNMGYWDAATIAEACLISGDVDKASQLYQEAVDLSPLEDASHKSTYRSVIALSDQLGLSEQYKNMLSKPFLHIKQAEYS